MILWNLLPGWDIIFALGIAYNIGLEEGLRDQDAECGREHWDSWLWKIEEKLPQDKCWWLRYSDMDGEVESNSYFAALIPESYEQEQWQEHLKKKET